MNETRGNSRTKPMRGGLKGGEINSLKDSEKTNELRIKGCLLHKSDLWKTPKKLYNYYKKQHYFDPCPTNPKYNGLQIEWKKYNFVNPPYSQITKWIDKAILEKSKGKSTVLLIPARTDTQWFKKLLINNAYITLIEGRLHFNDAGPAPFPSMLAILIPSADKGYHIGYISKENLLNK